MERTGVETMRLRPTAKVRRSVAGGAVTCRPRAMTPVAVTSPALASGCSPANSRAFHYACGSLGRFASPMCPHQCHTLIQKVSDQSASCHGCGCAHAHILGFLGLLKHIQNSCRGVRRIQRTWELPQKCTAMSPAAMSSCSRISCRSGTPTEGGSTAWAHKGCTRLGRGKKLDSETAWIWHELHSCCRSDARPNDVLLQRLDPYWRPVGSSASGAEREGRK